MGTSTHTVDSIATDGTRIAFEVEASFDSGGGKLIVTGGDFHRAEFAAGDVWDALIVFRLELERSDRRLLCAGARVDTWPSGMSRDMGGGRQAYITQIGKPATELLEIFSASPPELIGTVAEQREHHELWFRTFTQGTRTQHTISSIARDGTRSAIEVEAIYDGGVGKLIVTGGSFHRREFSAPDVWEALKLLRLELERSNERLLCAGARIDTWPSGMSRSMGGGRKAYVSQIGEPVPAEKYLDIFSESALEFIGTVAEQREHHDRWVRSVKGPRWGSRLRNFWKSLLNRHRRWSDGRGKIGR